MSETTSGSSDNEVVDGRGSAHKTSKSSKTAKKSLQVQGIPSAVRFYLLFSKWRLQSLSWKRKKEGKKKDARKLQDFHRDFRTWVYNFQSSDYLSTLNWAMNPFHINARHMLKSHLHIGNLGALDLQSSNECVMISYNQRASRRIVNTCNAGEALRIAPRFSLHESHDLSPSGQRWPHTNFKIQKGETLNFQTKWTFLIY